MVMDAESDERLKLCSNKPEAGDINSVFYSAKRMGEEGAEPVVDAALVALDLNANVAADRSVIGNERQACVEETNVVAPFSREVIEYEVAPKSKALVSDLNAEDVSSSMKNDHFRRCKNLGNLKFKDDSECASSVGPLEERDPLQVWKKMKKNGFLSESHGFVSMAKPKPKPKGRKAKSDGIKNKIEIAKQEQVDRFAKFAAPSGLLNGLNPGIINHVRNGKQVHSIIEALVKSEKNESCHAVKPGSQTKCESKELSERKYVKEVMPNPREEYTFNQVTQGLEPHLSCQMQGYPGSANRSVSISRGDGPLCTREQRVLGGTADASHVDPENISSLSNEDSANMTSVNSLSVKAASVASQWLELLHQDVKGRLAALRRSKKRVHEVIQSDFPHMLAREFPSMQENSVSTTESSVSHSNNATAEMHRTRWSSLFQQMEKALLEEENQLENWLSQVKQMQVHCDLGLFNYNTANELPQIGKVDIHCRSKKDGNLESDPSILAAAASIYSTCNFLSSMENLPSLTTLNRLSPHPSFTDI